MGKKTLNPKMWTMFFYHTNFDMRGGKNMNGGVKKWSLDFARTSSSLKIKTC